MKKFFTFAAALMATVAINATIVTLNPSDFTAVTTAAAIDQTVKDVHVEISNGLINADQIRVYKNATIKLTCTKEISAIVFTCTAGGTDNYGPGNFVVTAGDGAYSYKNTVGTWLGTATSITLKASGAQVRATKIEVYLDGETPAADTWVADTVSVSDARALIDASDAHDHYVFGVVAGQPFNLFSDFKDGKVTFWLTDTATPADSLEAYQVLGKDTAKWESLDAAWEELRVGDTVLVYASSLAKYGEIFEIASGFYAEKLGANPNPPAIHQRDTVTAAEAVEIAKTLTPASGKSLSTTDEYVVKGFVTKIKDADQKTYFLGGEPAEGYGDNFQAYQCASIDSEVALFDYVYVTGKIMNYNGGTYNNYEISKGTLVHGEAPKIDTIEVTPTEALALVDTLADDVTLPGMYAVKGFVGTAYDAEDGIQTFYVADEKGGFAKFQAYNANVGDAPVETGWEVRVIGKLYKHGSNATIKNGTVEVLATEGIENVVLTEKAQKVVVDGVVYIVRDNKMFDTLGNQVR